MANGRTNRSCFLTPRFKITPITPITPYLKGNGGHRD